MAGNNANAGDDKQHHQQGGWWATMQMAGAMTGNNVNGRATTGNNANRRMTTGNNTSRRGQQQYMTMQCHTPATNMGRACFFFFFFSIP